ncbi:MAG TPA: hypothetical protein VJN18_24710 [Polyangiaceae bacterium]|nr:hypothetical protein [Polyangiaceae bacterium]
MGGALHDPPSFWLRLGVAALATTQIQAACAYSPPPVPSSGQGADTLGTGRMSGSVEAGFGTSASWWNAANMTDVDLNSQWLGAARFRRGLHPNVDLGVVGGIGPQSTFVLGPEFKWRFGHLAAPEAEGPAFHAAWATGLGIGASNDYDRESGEEVRDVFLAPYTGVLGSGGVREIQMYVGFRFAASDTFFDETDDLTLYPILQFGLLLQPSEHWTFFAESDLAGGLTTVDFSDSALLFYPSAGVSFTWGGDETRVR